MTFEIVTSDTPECKCLACGYKFDNATNVEGALGPSPGDVTICLRCAHIMMFNDKLMVREATEEEREQIERDPHVQRLQFMAKQHGARWTKRNMH